MLERKGLVQYFRLHGAKVFFGTRPYIYIYTVYIIYEGEFWIPGPAPRSRKSWWEGYISLMKKIINIFKISDLRKKLAFTAGLLLVYRLGGKIPVNTSGGLKARGHAPGATGIAQIIEVVQQLRGEAGDRQVENAKIGMAENHGGTAATAVVHILEAE